MAHIRPSPQLVGRVAFLSVLAIFLKYEFLIKYQTEGLALKYESNKKPRTKIFD